MRRSTLRNIIIGIVLVAFVALFIFSIFKVFSSMHKVDENTAVGELKTIERNGVKYFPKQNVTTFLIIGTDREGPVKPSEYYTNDVCADVVMLVIFDNIKQTYKIININRDTMLSIPVIGVNGKVAGTNYGQLALAHTYGKGVEDSCVNTKNTVSEFLYGVHINYYASFSMDAISLLNDAVGGVKVNVTDDFSAVDSSIPMGEVVLNGEQAYSYIRSRRGVGSQLNVSRMERHQEYMRGFIEAFNNKFDNNDPEFAVLYSDLSPYMVTDCSSTVMSTLASRYCDYTYEGVYSPEGENKRGEYMEFYVNPEALDKFIIELLYDQKS